MKKEALVALILISLVVFVNADITGDWHKIFQRASRTARYGTLQVTPTQTQPTGPSGPTSPIPYQQPTAPIAPQPPAAPTPTVITAPAPPSITPIPTAPTMCIPGIESSLARNCNDMIDNDCDGLIDCSDATYCSTASNCVESKQNNDCADGIDNDGDFRIDCSDSGCTGPPECQTEIFNPYVSTYQNYDQNHCRDNLDNDADGLMDCKDPDCFNTCDEGPFVWAWILGAPVIWPQLFQIYQVTCLDGFDNDGNGLTDLAEPACSIFYTKESDGIGCRDGIDNDRNGAADCGDNSCSNTSACLEGLSQGITGSCSNLADDDLDGLIDCQDSDCCGPLPESSFCADNIDNDRDGFTDCSDSLDCGNNALCFCLESDNQIDPRKYGAITFGGMPLSYRHDSCIFNGVTLAPSPTWSSPIITTGTPTMLHETFCPPASSIRNVYQAATSIIINCSTVPGVVRGVCQNGQCV